MPELPDLLYIQNILKRELVGATVTDCRIADPVVVRDHCDGSCNSALAGQKVLSVGISGPFLLLAFDGPVEIAINLMLAGQIHVQEPRTKPIGHVCFSLCLADGRILNVSDSEKMAKVYVLPAGHRELVPALAAQGIDILSPAFTLERFRQICKQHSRKQVRVMINTHAIVSSIGNAYADEILFEAGIHPKTFVASLSSDQVEHLFNAIGSVMRWGAEAVATAAQPIHVKVRDHMRVRNRHGEPCPRCGATIRREGVRGHDVFFCPQCQPATRKHWIDWKKPGNAPAGEQKG